MGLYHSAYRGYGFEIPPTTDFEHLDEILAEQPDSHRVQHTYLGDFERLFLLTVFDEVEANTSASVTAADFQRYEIPAWNTALHKVAVRLGHANHPEPAWLMLHDHS